MYDTKSAASLSEPRNTKRAILPGERAFTVALALSLRGLYFSVCPSESAHRLALSSALTGAGWGEPRLSRAQEAHEASVRG